MPLTWNKALLSGQHQAERWSALQRGRHELRLRGDEHGRGFIFLTNSKTSQEEILTLFFNNLEP